MDKSNYQVDIIAPGIWSITDHTDSTAYLIQGRDKALLIDTTQGEGDFYGLVHSLTSVPVELLITHAHGDHYKNAPPFGKAYMHPEDIALLADFNEMFGASDVKPENMLPVAEGSLIDLGGGMDLEVLHIAGHTPGSIALLLRRHNMVFTGDAIGSGQCVWMQVPFALPLPAYRRHLERLLARLEPLHEVTLLGGHKGQSGRPGTPQYNPLTLQTIRDMIALCGQILIGASNGAPCDEPSFCEEKAYTATYGKAGMVYLPSRAQA